MSSSVATESEAEPTGKTEAPLEVRVSRAVPATVTHVWEVLVSPIGSQALLGAGAVLGAKGEPYHCADGTSGVLRSYHPLEQLRVSWHQTPDSPPSIVELDLRPDGDGTVLDLTHNHLSEGTDPGGLHQRWEAALDAVEAAARA